MPNWLPWVKAVVGRLEDKWSDATAVLCAFPGGPALSAPCICPTLGAKDSVAKMEFGEFFQAATGHKPFHWQRRLACGDAANGDSGGSCESLLINIPTGLGKTAAVVMAWLRRRRFAEEVIRRETPRRSTNSTNSRTCTEKTALGSAAARSFCQ